MLKLHTVIRDSEYSTRLSRRGSLIKEAYKVLNYMSQNNSIEEIKRQVLDGKLLHHAAYESRRNVWLSLYHRYLKYNPEWVIRDLGNAASQGERSFQFLSLFYLHYCLHDRVAYDFVVNIVWGKWTKNLTNISPNDILAFLEGRMEEHPRIYNWSERTKKDIASYLLSSLRDFGLLRGVQKKYIQKPTIPNETALHLLRILYSEGLRGQSIINSQDWKLFLWPESEVISALIELSLEKKIGFERAGSTVMLEVPEFWEVDYDSR